MCFETDHRHGPPTLNTHTHIDTLWSEVHLQFTMTITTPLRRGAGGEGEEEERS